MYVSRRIVYTFFFFLSCVRYFVGASSFGEDCRGKIVTDPNLKAAGHKYTCEFADDANRERLNAYCQRTSNTVSSRSSATCPAAGKSKLECHICDCAGTWKDGKCVNGALMPAAGGITSGSGTTPLAGNPPTTNNPPANGAITPLAGAVSGSQVQSSGSTLACAEGLLNSQGKCCQKVYYDLELKKQSCCEGILLNTNIPFLGQCIVYKKAGGTTTPSGLVIDQASAFPVLMGGLNRLVVSIILLISFVGILVAGVMIASSGASGSGATNGKKLIGNIVAALALLGASGVILKLINPNFFG